MKHDSGSGLADALFTRVQQRVLGILFSQPDRGFSANELIRLAHVGTGAVHRELTKLAGVGLVSVTPVGRQKLYQANRESPVFAELRSLVVKTVGLVEPLREALWPLRDRILVAFVYGSVAKGTDTARSDIDLMLITEDLSYAEAFAALEEAGAILGRTIDPMVISPGDWQKRRAENDYFAQKVVTQPRIFILGSEDELSQP